MRRADDAGPRVFPQPRPRQASLPPAGQIKEGKQDPRVQAPEPFDECVAPTTQVRASFLNRVPVKQVCRRQVRSKRASKIHAIEVVRLYRREALHEACRLEVSHRSDDDCPPLESARCRPCLNGPRPGRPSCGRTGAPVWAPTASPEKSGRPRAWSPITPSSWRWCMNRCKRAR